MQSAQEFSLQDIIETSRLEELEDDNTGEKFRTEVQVQKSLLIHRGMKRGDVVPA